MRLAWPMLAGRMRWSFRWLPAAGHAGQHSRNPQGWAFLPAGAFPAPGLPAFEVAFVLELDLGLLGGMGMDRGAVGIERGEGGIADLRATEQLRGTDRLGRGTAHRFEIGIEGGGGGDRIFFQPFLFLLLLLLLGEEPLPAFLRDETKGIALGHQAGIGIILSEQQAVLAAAGHHTVGVHAALGDKVIYQRADIGSGTIGEEGRLTL